MKVSKKLLTATYVPFLIQDIKRIAARRRYNSKALEDKIYISLQQTLNFNGSWAQDFRLPVRKLLSKAGFI
jgi:hypothetical protein